MSIKRLTHDGYGMLERNRVDPVNMESQCVLDGEVFPNGAEVGTLVAVNKAAGKIQLTGKLIGLLANSERLYDQYKQGLKNFIVTKDMMPTVLFLEDGHTFTTNTVCYDTSEFAAETNLIEALKTVDTTPLYGDRDAATGVIKITKTEGTAPLTVVKMTTMPDGQRAVKFIVTNAAAL